MNKWLLILAMLIVIPNLAWSQDRKIDQLEVYYSQKHYTKVIRKANKLLAIPDFDYSGMPTFYKSLAYLKLQENEDWCKKHKNSLTEGINFYKLFLNHNKSNLYVKSHYFEISELKQYLITLEKNFKLSGKTKNAALIHSFINIELKAIKSYGIEPSEQKKAYKPKPIKNKSESTSYRPVKTAPNLVKKDYQIREDLVDFALQYIGTPYLWAGSSPKGFDCSGYIGYIYKNYGISIPRSAAAQKEFSDRLKENEAMKGDLAFFKTGNKITHVGLIISNPGEPLKMVHSSSSKGIITTTIKTSTYWSKKFAGTGRIIHE